MSRLAQTAIRCLTAGLLLCAVAMAVKGLQHAWLGDGDIDMQLRVDEYEWFRRGVYPTKPLEPDVPKSAKVPYTVYPPYALPMFAVFFEPFGRLQGRIVIELLSLVSLVAMAAYGHRLLGGAGSVAAGLGAVAALAISGNGNAIGLGQFSILCAGAILGQIVMLERGRPLAAGAFWAAAMLKPQVGLAFAGVFLAGRQWRGLACGLGLLTALSLAACWWTEVPPLRVVDHWLFHIGMRFADESSAPGRLAEALGVDPRVLHLTAAALLVIVPILGARWIGALGRIDPLFLAGAAALCGGGLLYHRFYDNAMMFPLLFSALACATRRPTPSTIGIAAVMGASLWMPEQLIGRLPLAWLLRPGLWLGCAAALLVVQRRTGAAQAE